ncbi:MAG: hypothetical protein ACC641_03270 [Acidiferrobacterales bacterium]
MKVVKKTPEYTVYEKRSRRYAVKDADNKWVNADDKVKILLAEKLIEVKSSQSKSTEEAATEAKKEEVKAGEKTTSETPAEES